MFSLNKKPDKISQTLYFYYSDFSDLSNERLAQINQLEESIFRKSVSNKKVSSVFPADTDQESCIKTIYQTLIRKGAGQMDRRGFVPYLAISDFNCVRYLFQELESQRPTESKQDHEERIREAAWMILRHFRDGEPIPQKPGWKE